MEHRPQIESGRIYCVCARLSSACHGAVLGVPQRARLQPGDQRPVIGVVSDLPGELYWALLGHLSTLVSLY